LVFIIELIKTFKNFWIIIFEKVPQNNEKVNKKRSSAGQESFRDARKMRKFSFNKFQVRFRKFDFSQGTNNCENSGFESYYKIINL